MRFPFLCSAPHVLAALAAAAAPAAAQTGPFADGEIVFRGPGDLGFEALYRVDPLTGDGEKVVDNLFPNYSGPGWLAYDPYRDMLLAYSAYQPLGLFSPRLYGFGPDGTLTNLGFDAEDLQALTPIGDGRVYCYRNDALHVIDAGDNIVPVLDASSQPVSLFVDHLAYDAPTNSLIGATTWNTSAPCYQFKHITVHRFPLDTSGTKLSGPIVCSSFDVGASAYVIGMDPLPGGDLLVTLTGVSPFSDNVFLRVVPATLAVTVWGTPTLDDVDGGVWCPSLQRAVVLDDAANLLKTFTQGQTGSGTTLVVDVPVGDGQTGVSTANKLTDIELFGAACAGFGLAYGTGLAGTGGLAPSLAASTCPTLGAPLKLTLDGGVGGGLATVLIGGATLPYPLLGGTGYVLPPFLLQTAFALGGGSGVPGGGSGTLSIPTPSDPALLGVPFYTQGGVLDPGAVQGVSLTNAVQLQLG